ncbi:MAG TPA: protein translocase subunit SecF, partial [Phycisphaerae bacterium]|nr:protein translocase subunit SecF [Phycisphaerae bacterium]
ISVAASAGAAANEASVKAALTDTFGDLKPESRTGEAEARASEITEDLIRSRLLETKATVVGVTPGAESPEATAGVRFIPPAYRQYFGKIRLAVTLAPPRTLQEVRRRIDVFLRDRYPNLTNTLYRVDGVRAAERAGEYDSCEVWIAEDFNGSRGNMPAPAFWTDVVRSSLGAEEAFASTTSFEPTMAAEAWNKAVIAIVFSLIAIVLYMWFRFAKVGYGVAAVAALVHDVFIALGAVACTAAVAAWWTGNPFLITDMRINLPMVGAFLTLIGYSLNDTIVVFDRIRENRGKFGELSVDVVNRSINQTLSRTIWTSATTLVVVAVLYIRGGTASTIHGFSFVLALGILIGTYSSVAIASPILVLRGYLFRAYVWAFPVLGFLLLGYYAAVWQSPQQFFGTWVGWVWAGVQIAWIVLATWALWAYAYGQPWGLKEKAPWLATALAGLGLLMVPTLMVFCLLMLFAPEKTAWAGPAAVRALTTLPASYALYKLVWGAAPRKN